MDTFFLVLLVFLAILAAVDLFVGVKMCIRDRAMLDLIENK